jgi:hypothetical protein
LNRTPLAGKSCHTNWGSRSRSPGGASLKHKLCSNSLTIGQIFTQFLSWRHLMRIHYILHGFSIWPTFQGHRGQALNFLWYMYILAH